MMILKLQIVLLTVYLSINWTNAAEPHWGYPDLDKGEEFSSWGGVCDTGSNQSPIDLSLRGALKAVYDDLKFDNYDEDQKKVSMVNNGHTIQLSQFPDEMEVVGGPLREEYVLEQIHLHWWSEHTIDNIRFPLEVHIVHRNKKYPNMTMAANFKDGISVIGVLYHVSNEDNPAIQKIIDNLDDVKSYTKLNKPIEMKDTFIVRDLFPKFDGYLTYAGSLTTPSCAESVTWIVMHETFPVSFEQVEKFKEIEYDEDKLLKNNFRNIQNNNNRPIFVVLSEKSAASALQISLGFICLSFIFTRLWQ